VERDTRDVVRGALTNFAGVLVRSLTVLFYVYLARVYGPAVTGAFVVCQASLDIMSKLGLLGLDRGVLTVAARHHAAGNEPLLQRTIAQAIAIAAAASLALVAALEAVLAPAAGSRAAAADHGAGGAVLVPQRGADPRDAGDAGDEVRDRRQGRR